MIMGQLTVDAHVGVMRGGEGKPICIFDMCSLLFN